MKNGALTFHNSENGKEEEFLNQGEEENKTVEVSVLHISTIQIFLVNL